MTITDRAYAATRKHAGAALQALGVTRDRDFAAHKLEWQALNAAEGAIRKASSAIIAKMDAEGVDDTRAAELELAHDALMTFADGITREKDHRASIGDRGPRAHGHSPKVPLPGDVEAYGSPETHLDLVDRRADETVFLRRGMSMTEHLTRHGRGGDSAIRGVTEGGFLRAMVMGAKSDGERRALAEGSDSAGGFTVPDVLSARLIDRLRARSVVFQAGAVAVPLTSDRHVIARVASDPAPAWRLENAAIAESEPTFDAITIVPRSLAVLVKVSRELLADSLNLETALPEILAAAMAAELDRVSLLGTGTAPQPRGVANFSGLTASGFAGGTLKYADLVKTRTALRSANSDATAFIMAPRDEGNLAAAVDTTGQPLQVPPAIAQTPMLTTTAIPTNGGAGTNESMVLAGDWSKLMIAIRSQIQIEVSRELFSGFHQAAFIAHLRADIAAERAAHFTVLSGITG